MNTNWKSPRRLLPVIAGALVLLVAGLLIFFPVGRVKALAASRASAALGREVAIDEAKLSLRGGLGVRLQGLRVGNPAGFGGEPLAAVDAVDLRLRLAPLLRGRVEADRLVVTGPALKLRRLADGRDNFTFAPPAGGGAGGGKAGGKTPSVAAPSVALDRVAIVGGRLDFADAAAGTGVRLVGVTLEASLATDAAGRVAARGELGVDSLLVDGPAPVPALPVTLTFDLAHDPAAGSFTLAESALAAGPLRFKLSGDAARRDGGLAARGRLVSDRITAADLLGLLPADRREVLAAYRLAGDVVVEADASLEPGRAPAYAATASLTDLTMSGGELPGELRVASARADLQPDSLHVALTKASFGGRPLQGDFAVTRFADPRLRGSLSGEVDLAYLQPFLPPGRQAAIAGALTVRVEVDGDVKRPQQLLRGGEVVVSRMTYRDAMLGEPLTSLDAKLALSPEAVTIASCAARFGRSDVSLTGRLADPFAALAGDAARRPALSFAAHARRFDVDRIFPAASPAWVKRGTAAAAPAARDSLTGRLPDLRGAGTLRADSLLYGGVAFTSVTGDVKIVDRRIEVAGVKADVYTGKVTGSTTVDLNDLNRPAFGGRFAASRIEADDFLSRFTPLKGLLFGKFDLSGTYGAAGRDGAAVRSSLTLDAGAKMDEGRVVTRGPVHAALSAVATKAGSSFGENQALRALAAHVVVRDGRVGLDTLATRLGDLGELVFGGGYAFTGELDAAGGLLLSEDLSRKLRNPGGVVGRVTGLLGGGGGAAAPVERVVVPLRAGGTLTKPSVELDVAGALKEVAGGAAAQAAQGARARLRGLLGGGK
ncbi:MAG: AsmA family protein [bacterium]|nr:AsmA family protein [bacterium]